MRIVSCMTPVKVNKSHVAKTLSDAWIYWKLGCDAEGTSTVWCSFPIIAFYLVMSPLIFLLAGISLPNLSIPSPIFFHTKNKRVSSLESLLPHALLFDFFSIWMFSSAPVAAKIGSWLQWIMALFNQSCLHSTLETGLMKGALQKKAELLSTHSEMLRVKILSSLTNAISLLNMSN